MAKNGRRVTKKTKIDKTEITDSIVENNKCLEELERMTNCATMILDKLKLHYRKIVL